MDKHDIRQEMRQRKSRLTDWERRARAEMIFRRVVGIPRFATARNVLAYHALPDEVPTADILRRCAAVKELFLPRVHGDTLEILPYRPDMMQRGSFQIMEPMGHDTVDVRMMDVIIVPGVAFDRAGNRVGRGKGYYDRLLESHGDAVLIGIGYDFQLVEGIESEPHDVRMDYIVTDKEIILTNANQDYAIG
ncbi:MAG: 5-formyltetrahydrofolate cyclo-ligase [Pseudoflavonifractor sp.]|nr:5-formyltetrahydrofolate cyclo-ligase [Pseudoflavonifractor sp.]